MPEDEAPKQEDAEAKAKESEAEAKVKDEEEEEEEEIDPFPESPLSAERARIWEGSDRKLCISIDDGAAEFENLRARRIFPLSGKADYVSLQGKKDKEMVLLADLGKMDKESRAALEDALARMYYVARITRIDSIEETWGVSHWQVQTDRGYASFEVIDRSKIRKVSAGRLVITDADGNRFEVSNVEDMDEKSQGLVFSET